MLRYIVTGSMFSMASESRDGAASRRRDVAGFQRRAVTGVGHGGQLRLGGVQQLEAIHHDAVARTQESQFAGMLRAFADLGRGHV